jgi:hypothetical protein
MRTATAVFPRFPLRRSALFALALLGTACDDSSSPLEPPTFPQSSEQAAAPERLDPAAERGRWADGYATAANSAYTGTYTPAAEWSYNRSGGPITITKPANSTGRYIAKFSGLSALVGSRSTVQVTSSFDGNSIKQDTYCKPLTAYLVNDEVEVRCFRASTGAASNGAFKLLVIRNYADVAFAYGHQPNRSEYTPSAQGSWNPAGAIRVIKKGAGIYHVVFENLTSRLPGGVGSNLQVNAVGSGKVSCNHEDSHFQPQLIVEVRCYSETGAPQDSKFKVLLAMPANHLAYAWAERPNETDDYEPDASFRWNPSGFSAVVHRLGVGYYRVTWAGVDPYIVERGVVQVTAQHAGNAQCKVYSIVEETESARVLCFAPDGTPTDRVFSVLLAS